MQLKTTKSVIELLKEFNRYASVKTELESDNPIANRNYKIINCIDNNYLYDVLDCEFSSIFDEDTLEKLVVKVKLYDILKNEFGNEIFYQNLYFFSL